MKFGCNLERLPNLLDYIQTDDRGVHAQASTSKSLAELLRFLRAEKIPYSSISVGPVHTLDVMKASVMLEHDSRWAVVLAFDVKVEGDAQELADAWSPQRIPIFTANTVHHLKDALQRHGSI